jgi:hypothetical protein
MLPALADKRKIWTFITIYISAIYLTLSAMPPVLDFIYSTIGRESLGKLVNSILFLSLSLIVLVSLKKGILKSFLIALPMIVVALFVYEIDLPEERVHFLEYGLLGILFIKAVGTGYRQIAFSLVCVLLAGCIDELIQFLLPNRVGELRDVVMNSTGGVLGLWVGIILYWSE